MDTESQRYNNTSKQLFDEKESLFDLGLMNDMYFTLSYKNMLIDKTGLLAKFKNKQEPFDIDLACGLYNEEGEFLELVWFKQLRDNSESICHSGDQLLGFFTEEELEKKKKKNKSFNTADEYESIHLNLKKMPKNVHTIALFIASFQDYPLAKVELGDIELEDVEGNTAMRVELPSLASDCKAMCLASIHRFKLSETKLSRYEHPPSSINSAKLWTLKVLKRALANDGLLNMAKDFTL